MMKFVDDQCTFVDSIRLNDAIDSMVDKKVKKTISPYI